MKPEHVSHIVDSISSIKLNRTLRVGIDGFCASGKTTLSNALKTELEKNGFKVTQVCGDDFLNPDQVRWQLGQNSPEGFYKHAINHEAIVHEVLEPLEKDSSNSILLLDGLFLHDELIQKHLDFTIFIEAPFEICIARARDRNQENMASAVEVEAIYRNKYVPGFELYLSERNPKHKASTVIINDD